MPEGKLAKSIQIAASPEGVLGTLLNLDLMHQWWNLAWGLVEARK